MTAETDLLPLPEPVAVKYPDSGLRDDEHALRLWAAHGYDTGGEPLFSAEQLREAVAPLQAEIEALRAERDAAFRMSRCECSADECCANLVKHQQRAERLAEALRWALPLASQGLEMYRLERLRCGHGDITGTYKNGETWAGIHQEEVDGLERARALLRDQDEWK